MSILFPCNPDILVPDTHLQGGKYRIISAIGCGAFDNTYLAEQVKQGRRVCIKEFFVKYDCEHDKNGEVIIPHPVEVRNWVQHFRAKFVERADLLSRLEHPNLVKVHDVFLENNTAYYVMDYIEGETLQELVKRSGALEEQTAVRYITGVAGALKLMHAEKVNNLQVKPAHIMLRKSDGEALLFDFGYDEHYDGHGDPMADIPFPAGINYGYTPGEQYISRPVLQFSPQTDIYSLGATLYFLLLGERPPELGVLAEEGLPDFPSNISAGVQNAVRAAMQLRKGSRPENIDKWLAMLLPADVPDNSEKGFLSRLKSLVRGR